VSRQTVWYWETGRSAPSPRNLGLLATALGVATSELAPGAPAVNQGFGSLATVKQWLASELGVAPDAVEIHIRL
jgi:transcriptional regulator with XRE-family HTH domain